MDDTCSPVCTMQEEERILTRATAHCCADHIGQFQRAPCAMSADAAYCSAPGTPGAVLGSHPDANLSLRSWGITKGHAYRKLSGYQHMHHCLISSAFNMTGSQINFNDSLITGSDAKEKSEIVCLISNA